MSSVPVFVGLDYHSGSIQVCVVDAAGKVLVNAKRASTVLDVASIIEPLGGVQRVAIEACSGAADFGDHLSRHTGWRVVLSHTGMVARMRSSIDKTDRTDARVLADLCRTGYLPEVWLAPEPIRELRTLVRRRHQLTDGLRQTKQRIKALLREKRLVPPPETGARWTKRYRRWLETVQVSLTTRMVINDLLGSLDAESARRARLDGALRLIGEGDRLIRKLLGIKGVGIVTACTLRAVVGRFDRFRNAKQFARYCGLTPRNVSSGERTGDSGLVRAADPGLKSMLVQVAHRAARFEAKWCTMLEGMLERGKPKCVAIVAVANRWARCVWHEMKVLGEPGLEGLALKAA
ncbi:MAG: IS110 family transposase [Phycisphaerales bacterium]|nr:IS110 family transposase [Phycisphaerales bacterium]